MTLALVLAAALSAASPPQGPVAPDAGAKPICPPSAVFDGSLDHLEGYRVFTGPDGDSEVEPYRIDARTVPLLKTGRTLKMLELPTAPKRAVQIVVGPPNFDLPMHPAPYREMFIMLSGSVTVTTAKFRGELKAGSVLLFDDVDAKIGHGGRIGPCGYTSVSIAP